MKITNLSRTGFRLKPESEFDEGLIQAWDEHRTKMESPVETTVIETKGGGFHSMDFNVIREDFHEARAALERLTAKERRSLLGEYHQQCGVRYNEGGYCPICPNS